MTRQQGLCLESHNNHESGRIKKLFFVNITMINIRRKRSVIKEMMKMLRHGNGPMPAACTTYSQTDFVSAGLFMAGKKKLKKRLKNTQKFSSDIIVQNISGNRLLQTRAGFEFRHIIWVGQKTDIPDRVSLRRTMLITK